MQGDLGVFIKVFSLCGTKKTQLIVLQNKDVNN